MPPSPDVLLPVVSVGDVTPGGGVRVEFPSGAFAWLPYDHCGFVPGAVVVPVWLYRRLRKNKTNHYGKHGWFSNIKE